ncbi:9124_t:CDS:1, partial [Rhizophagus irregularis]
DQQSQLRKENQNETKKMKSSIEDIQLLFTTTVLALRLATIACTRSSTATSGGVKDEEGQKTQDKKMKN